MALINILDHQTIDKIAAGELVGEYISVPGVAAREAFPDGGLALGADVAVGGVEVVEARL